MPLLTKINVAFAKLSAIAMVAILLLLFITHQHQHDRGTGYEAKKYQKSFRNNDNPQEFNEMAAKIKIKDTFEESNVDYSQDHQELRLLEKQVLSRNLCPAMPPNLKQNVTIVDHCSMEEVVQRLSNVIHIGGSWWPTECTARWMVAIIVPVRNGENQIAPFLNHMHPFLMNQQLNYTIFLVVQEDDLLFNRAKLFNAGYLEARKDAPYDCYIFHDIHLLPEDSRHLYHCSAMPRHLNVVISYSEKQKENFSPKDSTTFGGSIMMTENHVQMVNGWSNKHWGWGGDNDMRKRIASLGLHLWRYPKEIARYKSLQAKNSTDNTHRDESLKNNTRLHQEDGLNSVTYKLMSKVKQKLFTEIKVNLTEPLQQETNLE